MDEIEKDENLGEPFEEDDLLKKDPIGDLLDDDVERADILADEEEEELEEDDYE